MRGLCSDCVATIWGLCDYARVCVVSSCGIFEECVAIAWYLVMAGISVVSARRVWLCVSVFVWECVLFVW